MTGIGGLNAYKQTNQLWNKKSENSVIDNKSNNVKDAENVKDAKENNIKTNIWKAANTNSSLVPTNKDGIGMSIGDVKLSDKAKEYFSKLKSKFGNMEFIAVSKDMKEQVKSNIAAYGNANKMIVLIDDAKLEQMANDESFRKKYEGIIAMSQNQMAAAKNSLASSGAKIKNFGMSVNSDGSTSFFATLEKSSKDQAKRISKKQAEKKAAKIKEKKLADKKAQKKHLEKIKEENKVDNKDIEEKPEWEDKDYIKFEANSMEELVDLISKYAYDNSLESNMTEEEKVLGQNFDFKG
ncbi:MAG: DUF6033 family protein [Lachnospiraceae bacterium]|nr:DUF6033 family protein [Lachnospiraceae bacterium]